MNWVVFLLVLVHLGCLNGEENIEELFVHDTRRLIQALETRKLQDKIVGGDVVTEKLYPMFVSFQRKSGSGFKHFCGGSMISSRFLLSAAHCFKYEVPPDRIQIGVYDLSKPGTDVITIVSPVKKVTNHPDYYSYDNDISLLELKKPISGVKFMELNRVRDNKFEKEKYGLDVIGFGYTSEGSGQISNDLRVVNVPVVSLPECRKSYGNMIHDGNICAGYTQGGKDSCSGDSGGPLLSYESDMTVVQVGVVSWGRGCAQKRNYGVYSRVSSYYCWIVDTAGLSDEDYICSEEEPDDPVPTPTDKPTPPPTMKPGNGNGPPTPPPTFNGPYDCYIAEGGPGFVKSEGGCQLPFAYKDWNGQSRYFDYPPTIKEARPYLAPLGNAIDPDDGGLRWCPPNGVPLVNVKGKSSRKKWGVAFCRNAGMLPTAEPTQSPVPPTFQPTDSPTPKPTRIPTRSPTQKPSKAPTPQPTRKPTNKPTQQPTKSPTGRPSFAPTPKPTDAPTTLDFAIRDAFCRTKGSNQNLCESNDFWGDRCRFYGGECRGRLETVAPTLAPSKAPTQKPTLSQAEIDRTQNELNQKEQEEKRKNSIIGIAAAVGGLVVLGLIIALVIVKRRRTRRNEDAIVSSSSFSRPHNKKNPLAMTAAQPSFSMYDDETNYSAPYGVQSSRSAGSSHSGNSRGRVPPPPPPPPPPMSRNHYYAV